MCRIIFIIIFLINTISYAAQQFYPLEKIKSGQIGYALTTFKETTPEKFKIEAISVLKNYIGNMDMILVKCHGDKILKYKVSSGMSGSPVYIEGKLVGAISAAIDYSQEPFAFVTPINYMISELDRPKENKTFYTSKSEKLPVYITGLSQNKLNHFSKKLSETGFEPIMGIASSKQTNLKTKLSPGSPVAIKLVTGDIELATSGTITHIENDKIYALGHYLMNCGECSFPMSASYVHTIIPREPMSIRMDSTGEDIGAITQDRASGILGILNKKTDLIPVSISIYNAHNKIAHKFNVKIVRHKYITLNILSSLLDTIFESFENTSADSTIDTTFTFKIKGVNFSREIELKDTFFNSLATFNDAFLKRFKDILLNPFCEVTLDSLDAKFTIYNERRIASIENVWTEKNKIKRGDDLTIKVLLKTYNQKYLTLEFNLTIPDMPQDTKNISKNKLEFFFSGGIEATPISKEIRTLDDYILEINNSYDSKDIVLEMRLPYNNAIITGKILNDLPFSITNLFNAKSNAVTNILLASKRLNLKTDYIIVGKRKLEIDVLEKLQ